MSDNIVADWLKTIELERYAQAFLDNGYDELEVCKQIGDPDLDAIGVTKVNHRRRVLQAVVKLKEEGGTSVYFTLETQNSVDDEDKTSSLGGKRLSQGSTPVNSRSPLSDSASPVKSDVMSIADLKDIIRNRIIRDGINLVSPPYTRRDWTGCKTSLENLSAKYAVEFGARTHDVVEILEDLRQWLLHRDSELFYSSSPLGTPPSLPGSSSTPGTHSFASSPHHTPSHLLSPPALPISQPPCLSHVDIESSIELHSVNTRYDSISLYGSNYAALETVNISHFILPSSLLSFTYMHQSHEKFKLFVYILVCENIILWYLYLVSISTGMCCVPILSTRESTDGDRRKTSTLGRFFRNMGIRRSGKKHQYKQHNGDPVASTITMGDDDRMALMFLVKEGKLTTEQALQMVKDYEDERRRELQLQNDRNGAQKKKKQGGKPVKSPSAVMQDCAKRCEVCQRLVSPDRNQSLGNFCTDPSHRHECFQHRRVHSVSHIDLSEFPRSPEAARAMSCTPTRGFFGYGSRLNSPVTFYSPSQSSRLYSPVVPQDGKYYHTGHSIDNHHGNVLKTSASIHHSPSQNSSMSLESEQSMDCQHHGPTTAEMAAMRGDNLNYGSNSSAMSFTSDLSPAVNWRKTVESDDQGHKTSYGSDTVKSASSDDGHRSASSGTTASMHSASPGSGKSSCSMEEGAPGGQDYPTSLVRVHTDYIPTKSEVDMLQIKRGDVIWVASRSSMGLWKGVLNGRSGWFKPSFTEPCTPSNEASSVSQKGLTGKKKATKKSRPKTVQELLQRIGLEGLETLFIQNGFDHLETFADLNEDDLNALRIYDPQHRAKLLTAAELLLNMEGDDSQDSPEHGNGSRFICHTPLCYSPRMVLTGEYPNARSCPTSRDSGCYGSWEQLGFREASNKMAYGVSVKHSNGFDKDRTFSPLQHSNKENVHPGSISQKVGSEQRLASQQTNSSGRGSASSGRASVETCHHYGDRRNSDMERSDKEFTEEDREVYQITSGVGEGEEYCYDSQSTPKSGLGLDMSVNSAGSAVIMCSYAETQTSPSQGQSCNGSRSNNYKPQPFPRKIAPKTGLPSKDVQVQVMCPLGNSTNSKIDFDAYQIRAPKDAALPTQFHRQYSSPCFSHANVEHHRKFSDSIGLHSEKIQNGSVGSHNLVQYHRDPNKVRAKSIDEGVVRPTPSPRDYKSVKKSLISLVTSKLANEKIDLSMEPYSSKSGKCGIPPLLIQRYADELKHDVPSICLVIEQVRIHTLTTLKRQVIPADDLAETSKTGCELKIQPIPEFFTAIGLPMYTDNLIGQNFTSLEQLFELTNQELRDIIGAPHKHSKRIIHALEWLKKKKLKSSKDKETVRVDRV
ncbi:hypothetical protein FSP39_024839 [Pinctada imbricata]|uniref:Sterile alpha motif domain-containing protein 5 n=1 Tax=Pinctada imbricata TaxID=66713 RepID=A0AA88XUR4_PINIB|nr:hypothetical protein FSP39_024839 [Pinctada imbricata]